MTKANRLRNRANNLLVPLEGRAGTTKTSRKLREAVFAAYEKARESLSAEDAWRKALADNDVTPCC
jgi:hypothetical protein